MKRTFRHACLSPLLFVSLPMFATSYVASRPVYRSGWSGCRRQCQRRQSVLLQDRQTKYEELMRASPLSLAPMMEYTDRHFRHLVRLISSRTLLYTEMVAANAIAHERRNRMEDCIITSQQQPNEYRSQNEIEEAARTNYDDFYLQRYLAQGQVEPREGPSVLQLGGSDPQQLFEASQTVVDLTERGHCDYTAINLNCGCPSPKVAGKGCFGAALMDEPTLVAELTRAIHEGCGASLPVTVKCRIGTDSEQSFTKQGYLTNGNPEKEYENLCRFIETVASDGVVTDFCVHARIAVLQKSFTPSDNRKIPPLKYDVVRRLVSDFPDLTFTLNGGIESISKVAEELEAAPGLKGVMVGRAWAADPWSFAMADQLLYGDETAPKKNRLQILEEYGRHADAEEARGDPVKIRRFIVKAVSPLFTGESNSKRYRVALDDIAGRPKKLILEGNTLSDRRPLSELIMSAAVEHLSEETLLRTPEESYERLLWAERNRCLLADSGKSASIDEWQAQKRDEARTASSLEGLVAG